MAVDDRDLLEEARHLAERVRVPSEVGRLQIRLLIEAVSLLREIRDNGKKRPPGRPRKTKPTPQG